MLLILVAMKAVQLPFSALKNLQYTLESAGQKANIRGRVKFAVLYQRLVDRAEQRLEVSKSTLLIALQLLDLHSSAASQTSLSNLLTGQHQIQKQLEATHASLQKATALPRAQIIEDYNYHSNSFHVSSYPELEGPTGRVKGRFAPTLDILSWGNTSVLVCKPCLALALSTSGRTADWRIWL